MGTRLAPTSTPLTFLAEDMHLSKPTVLSVVDRWHTKMINAGTAP